MHPEMAERGGFRMKKKDFDNNIFLLEFFNQSLRQGEYRCVIETLTSEYQYDEDKNRCFIVSENCSECISRYFQEAVKRLEEGEGK
jgi:hypothetical protein